AQRRLDFVAALTRHSTMSLEVAEGGKHLVQRQPGAELPERQRAATIDGEEEAEWGHQMWSQTSSQQIALSQGLEHECDIACLKIPKATVHELGGAAAGAARKVSFVDEDCAQPA